MSDQPAPTEQSLLPSLLQRADNAYAETVAMVLAGAAIRQPELLDAAICARAHMRYASQTQLPFRPSGSSRMTQVRRTLVYKAPSNEWSHLATIWQ